MLWGGLEVEPTVRGGSWLMEGWRGGSRNHLGGLRRSCAHIRRISGTEAANNLRVMDMRQRDAKAFTVVELLVVISIIALLISILLPAVTAARDQARLTISRANLRNLATAHASYAAEWNDRQFTLSYDRLSALGSTPSQAMAGYYAMAGQHHPPLVLGWAVDPKYGDYGLWRFFVNEDGFECLAQPIVFEHHGSGPDRTGFGYFRIPNVKQFNQYVGGRYYDRVFFAPKDRIIYDYARPGFEDPAEYTPAGPDPEYLMDRIVYPSYCLSPAALFSPDVMRRKVDKDSDVGGWMDPWGEGDDRVPGALRAPSMSHAKFPNLKTHMLEHHWLQNRRLYCNPSWVGSTYDGCEPFYFNHGYESEPVAMFYDGHVESVGVREAIAADARVCVQTGTDPGTSQALGLWLRDTPLGGMKGPGGPTGGYFMDYSYDTMAFTSFHILTADGIRGRDIIPN